MASTGSNSENNLGWWDAAVIALYLLFVIGIGIWVRQNIIMFYFVLCIFIAINYC